MRKIASICMLLASLLPSPGALSEETHTSPLSALQGAWVQPSEECSDVYVRTKRGMAFKRPVSVFSPALLITGRKIATPGAMCRIQASATVGDRQALTLSCTNAIATEPLKALLSVSSDGALYRYTGDGDRGTRYVRCGP